MRGGVRPSSRHWWDTTIIDVAPEELCGVSEHLNVQDIFGDRESALTLHLGQTPWKDQLRKTCSLQLPEMY